MNAPTSPRPPRRPYGARWHERLADQLRRRFVQNRVVVSRRPTRSGVPQAVETLAPPPLVEDHRPTSQSLPHLSSRQQIGIGGVALLTVAFLLVGFFLQLFLLSPIFFMKQQQVMYDDFRFALANATAPVGQVTQEDQLLPQGTPVAVIDIDKIGVHAVVVEGTSSRVLLSGPGHRRDTPLPGQSGTSVIYGRQFTYGGPFAGIESLHSGDKIVVTTGQGKHTYTVNDIRYTGDPIPVVDDTKAHLTLVSAAGLPLLPAAVVRVDATLMGSPADTPAQMFSVETLDQSELPMFGDPGAWGLLALEIVFIGLLMLLLWLSLRYWGLLQTWVVGIPVTLAVGIATSIQISFLLPNLI